MITLTDVSLKRNHAFILNDINLSFQKGELIGVLGPNGAGKTTLFHILMGSLHPSQGSIHYHFSSSKTAWDIKKHIGVVLEDSFLYEDFSVRENLQFFAKLYQVQDAKKRIDELLDFFQMERQSDELINTLSKGLKKRVSLIRGILHRPILWLLDEPFDGLDQLSVQILCKQMIAHVSTGGTVMFISHSKEHIFHMATRGLLLMNGKIKIDCQLPSELERLEKAYNLLFEERLVNDGLS